MPVGHLEWLETVAVCTDIIAEAFLYASEVMNPFYYNKIFS